MARILITTFGSYGDLHPYIAVALGLKQRGHQPIIATSASYRAKVEAEGLLFHAVRPDLDDFGPFAEIARRVYDPKTGTEYLLRELVLPRFADTYDDLTVAAQRADLLVTHALTYAAHLFARSHGLRWISTILSPMVFMSAYDPPRLPPAPWLKSVHGISPTLYRILFSALKRISRGWSKPIREFCRSRGLPVPPQDPLFEGQYSPQGTLAMFSPLLARPQPDWPPRTHVTGFPLHDSDEVEPAAMDALDEFLAAGEAPIVFTLGSSAIYDAGDFYARSVEIAQRLNRRAVLLTGRVAENQALPTLPATVFACDYAPHSRVFPRAAVNVHQGGIGTLAQAMYAGRPMLVVPFSHDQPDNAQRAERLGIGRTLPRAKFSVPAAVAALGELLAEPHYATAATDVARTLQQEDGVAAACDRLEAML
jgi:UDP:flavonoid glycosyltransferase YjiC (YdhE family)